MSWYEDKIVLPVHPVTFSKNGKTFCGAEGIFRELPDGWSWEDLFIYQQNNRSGIPWSDEEYSRRMSLGPRTFKVKSSNGKSFYNVIVRGDNIICNCTGYAYRKNCRHCDEIRKALI